MESGLTERPNLNWPGLVGMVPSKVVGVLVSLVAQLINPFTILMLGLGIALIRYRQIEWLRGSKLTAAVWIYVLLFLYCLPAVSAVALNGFEGAYPRLDLLPPETEAIVVLGGNAIRNGSATPSATTSGDAQSATAEDANSNRAVWLDDATLQRCAKAVALYRKGPRRPLIITGGLSAGEQGPPVARIMEQALREMGIPAEDLIVEDQSANTVGNAQATGDLLRQRRWRRIVLVTSASHLVRAVRLFRNQGLEVVPAGCAYRSDAIEWNLLAFVPRSSTATANQELVHECLGIAASMWQGSWWTKFIEAPTGTPPTTSSTTTVTTTSASPAANSAAPKDPSPVGTTASESRPDSTPTVNAAPTTQN